MQQTTGLNILIVEDNKDRIESFKRRLVVAKWLEENPKFQPKQIIVHSLNAVGRKNILAALPNAIEMPWAWEKI